MSNVSYNDRYAPLMTQSLALTLSSDVNLATLMPPFARRLFIGTAGDVKARKVGDSASTVYKCVAGQYLDGAWILVESTGHGTTASNIVAER